MANGVLFQYFEWNYPADGSLWRDLAAKATDLSKRGITAIWMPPASKAMGGGIDVGYAPYDLYDLGEFDQKASIRTKYGTRAEFLAAIKSIQSAGMQAYADIVLNHRMGGDETEEVEVEEISCDDRRIVQSGPYKIKAWSKFQFAARKDQYSAFKWHARHFNAFGANANAPDEHGKIFRVVGKTFAEDVCAEHGNFDYLMGADVDVDDPEARQELMRWGKWFLDTTGVDGFRADAVKHIPASFFKDWFTEMRAYRGSKGLFGVGEYWSANLGELQGYLKATDRAMCLFDVPLHDRLKDAASKGRSYDLRSIFDQTLLKADPASAVTFVDNHDSQPGQSLQSWVDDWFKPLAYALILLRKDGFPCVFYGDYFGNSAEKYKLTSHRTLIDAFLEARHQWVFGDQHDYFDHPNCIGWVCTGNPGAQKPMAVLMSNGDAGSKKMKTFTPSQAFRDMTGHWPEPITTDENGEAEFRCPGGKVSVWSPT